VTGRSKDMIIRRGQHMYPEEVENALERSLGFANSSHYRLLVPTGDCIQSL